MWPKTIVMSKDECRGALRRLELESYAALISVFRAQGCLNEAKSKVLEDLRNMFRISQERHRAEARRVSNDEQLCTIAENLAGPNTWQEWAREGRRPFPLLARVPPQTALNIIANKIAAKVTSENSKLPLPSETGVEYKKLRTGMEAADKNNEHLMQPANIVTSNPYPAPNIPDGPKRTLKRNAGEGQNAPSRKRAANEPTTRKSPNISARKYLHITSDGNLNEPPQTSVQNMYAYQSNINQPMEQNPPPQPQPQHTPKPRGTRRAPQNKRQDVPPKVNKRKQNLVLQQEPLQISLRITQPQFQYEHLQSGDQISHLDAQAIVASADYLKVDNIPENENGSYVAPTSRKDVTKNYARLNVPATITSGQLQQLQNVNHTPTITTTLNATSPTTPVVFNKLEKQPFSTPVKKYIVEDRQPTINSPQGSHILTFPHSSPFSTTAKLRGVNTTILPPGTKITAKRMPTSTVVSAAAVNNANVSGLSVLADQASMSPALAHPSTNEGLQQPAQGKVLTTKILPLMLGASGNSVNSTTTNITPSSSTQITKIDILNNGANVIGVGSGTTHAGTTLGGATIMKKLQSPVMLSQEPSGSGTTGTNIHLTSVGSSSAGTTVFRKPSIIKTNILGRSTSSVSTNAATTAKLTSGNSNPDGPKIISNIKLVPTISATPATATQQQYLQQQLKNANTGLRTSVKICQSANGKVFIQPANVDATKSRTQTSTLQKNLGMPLATSAPQQANTRFAIQKVQIIPASMSSPTLQNSIANYQQTQQKHISFGNKMYIPGSNTVRTATGSITLSAANLATDDNESSSQGTIVSMQQKQAENGGKANVLLIGPTSSTIENQKHNTTGNILQSPTKPDSAQMITEDTPIDIIGAPILVNNSGNTIQSNAHAIELKGKGGHEDDSTFVLGATDWEMELDQATAFAAVNKSNQHGNVNKATYQHDHVPILVDDSFEDEIIVEENEEMSSSNITANTHYADNEHYSVTNIEQKPGELRAGVEHSGTIIIQPADYAAHSEFEDAIEIDENTAIEYIEHDPNPGPEDNMDKTDGMHAKTITDREYVKDLAVTYATK
ncbi:BRCA2-interacting transcriptional repressor EMSY [Teleopsis dalmanni]|uniref:BRCA2-interacting transcriptional repressor EMSY n=1 Tax=Teleopsis dalmanni TaxID=139649 RepID=UPI0018CE6030|nr:BRCA2-interacting transcriptional repressor EMSY [Teleopsis dalmanni]